ncbi:MAG: hypothetical protein CM15mP58_11820 [Burkholderiaceae bacterium]|nr:MAG: hypothetical protein CM15mP58_11820 [Burkholderiaceae bacterium]
MSAELNPYIGAGIGIAYPHVDVEGAPEPAEKPTTISNWACISSHGGAKI